jgi:hypothetical protein
MNTSCLLSAWALRVVQAFALDVSNFAHIVLVLAMWRMRCLGIYRPRTGDCEKYIEYL